MANVLWSLGVHTVGKHIVLRSYLQAWLPILGTWSGRIVFVDGFAGPGEYESGEEGSPVIALRAFLEHTAKNKITAEVVFVFIEADEQRAEHLRRTVAPLVGALPSNAKVEVTCAACAPTLDTVLDGLDASGAQLAPAFVMLDPFGVKDTPLRIVERLLRHQRSELFISFMWESINRWKATPEFEEHLDAMFGSPLWRAGLSMGNTEERKQYLHGLYEAQLRKAGARYVTHFELWTGGKHVYSIFFATKHSVGFDKMKQAIWRADRTGGYAFRGSRGEQISFDVEPDLTTLLTQLRQKFGPVGWTTIEEIEDWARSDATAYHSGQVKEALRRLEDAGHVEAESRSDKKRRKRTFPPGTRVRITPEA
jgi:three-Cys-motif partner protein